MLISASDPVAATLASALDGLLLRQRVAADNIANVDTPDFIASEVDFESSLTTALADGVVTGTEVTPGVTRTTDAPGANGNNVDLGEETLTAMQATFQYQLLTRAVADRHALVSTAIGGM